MRCVRTTGLSCLLAVVAPACGPIDLGSLPPAPPALQILAIADGSEMLGDRRPVTIGQAVRVMVWVANRGAGPAAELSVELTLHRRSGENVADAAVITPMPGARSTLAAGDTAPFGFEVRILPVARPDEWLVSAQAHTRRGSVEAPEAVRRVWILQLPPQLVVQGFDVAQGNRLLGHLSVNPGCPALLAAGLRNAGEAGVEIGQAMLVIDGRGPGLSQTLVGLEPGNRLPGQGTATATFRVEAAPSVTPGAQFSVVRPVFQATDLNSGAPVGTDARTVAPIPVVATPTRLVVAEVRGPLRAQAGQMGLEFGVRLRYLPGPASAPSLGRVSAALRFDRAGTEWVVRPEAENPTSLPACPPPPNPCEGTVLSFSVDVPEGLAGPVTVSAAGVGVDVLDAPLPEVAVCGASHPEQPASVWTMEIAR